MSNKTLTINLNMNSIFQDCLVYVSTVLAIASCIIMLVYGGFAYNKARNDRVAEMAIAGIDPVSAAVALDNIYDEKAKTYYLGKSE